MILEIALGILLGYILITLLPLFGCLLVAGFIIGIFVLLGIAVFAGGSNVFHNPDMMRAFAIIGLAAMVVTVVKDRVDERQKRKRDAQNMAASEGDRAEP